MNYRMHHARILTMEEGRELISGELWVSEGKVAYVGPERADRPVFDREIDLEGNLILPGFKNAHTHSGMTFLRSYADDLPLLEWLNTKIFPMEAKLREGEMYWLTKLAMMEYIAGGMTACFDMYFYPEEVAQAAVDCGFRTVMCGGINDYGGTVAGLDEMYHTYNRLDPLVGYRLGFHGEYTTARSMLDELAELVRERRAPLYTHNSESLSEVKDCLARTGMTPTAYLDSLGLFDYGGGGFHCVHMTEEDMDIFLRRGLWVITNPASNCKLASGIAPLCRMREKGIGIAIGTDGPASNNCLDMFREMFLATALQKVRQQDASAMPAEAVLRMATTNGARAIGLTDCDTLAEGKEADLIVLDLQKPNMQPINNVAKNVVYSGSRENVLLTMVAGRILYEKGRFLTVEDPEEVYRRVQEIIDKKRD